MNTESTSSGATPLDDAPEAPKPRRRQKLAPKSRSGCQTCKKRRVKCDESKPSCRRCVGYGVQCEGYIIITKGHETRGLPRVLAPATGNNGSHLVPSGTNRIISSLKQKEFPNISNTSSSPQYPPASSSIPGHRIKTFREETDPRGRSTSRFVTIKSNSPMMISPPPSGGIFSSFQEQQYFDYFRNFTVNRVSGWFLGSVWKSLVLQAAHHQESFVRSCLLAIGAISKSQEHQKLETGNEKKLLEQHRYFAFRQYGKAVQLIRNSVSQNSDIRTVLLSCLLLVCFEDILGGDSERKAICTQIGNAVNLFFDWAMTQRRKGIPHPHEGLYSPNPAVIEDDLYQAFLLLDLKCMYAHDTRSFTTHMKLAGFANDTILNMPAVFNDVKHAELYCSLIIRRAMHYLTAVRQAAIDRTPLLLSILETHVELTENPTMEPRIRLKTIIAAGFKKYLIELHLLYAAFQPLLEVARREKGSKPFIHAMILESYIKYSIQRFARPMSEKQPNEYTLNGRQAEKIFFKPSQAPHITELGELDEERMANPEILPPIKDIRHSKQAEKYLPPVHIYKGVKYGYLNPLEGFGWQRGAAAAWYEERSQNTRAAETDLIILYESIDTTGRVEIEIVTCSQPGDLGPVPPISQVRRGAPLCQLSVT